MTGMTGFQPRNNPCSQCRRSFANARARKNHERAVHGLGAPVHPPGGYRTKADLYALLASKDAELERLRGAISDVLRICNDRQNDYTYRPGPLRDAYQNGNRTAIMYIRAALARSESEPRAGASPQKTANEDTPAARCCTLRPGDSYVVVGGDRHQLSCPAARRGT